MSIIEVNNLRKTYTTYKRGSGFKESVSSFFHREKVNIDAVADISFSIEKGEICGILGPNGAGKSTTIKMLCGALFPTSGEITVMNFHPAEDRKKYVSEIGAVFGQKSQLIWDIPPIDSFAMNKAIYGIPDADYKARLDEFVSIFDIGEVMHKPTRVLSLGERMKCEFVMAMLHNPKVVFLDEPTIGLDVIAKTKIREFIRSMNEKGTTFILTTHDLEDVEQLAQRVIVINHGKKVFDDTLHNLRLTLGDKKIIELTMPEQPDISAANSLFDGVVFTAGSEPNTLSAELDLEKVEISGFIQQLSEKLKFTDISVKELPMDVIITRIYEK